MGGVGRGWGGQRGRACCLSDAVLSSIAATKSRLIQGQ